MEPRKKQKKKPTTLPADFLKNVGKLFNKQFKAEKASAEFLFWGDLYMDEVLLCVSLMQEKNLRAGTMYISIDLPADLSQKPDQVTDKLKAMVDVAASWFNQCFTERKEKGLDAVLAALDEVDPVWQKIDWEAEKIFVKLNKDNHLLEKAANQFLRTKGVKPEELEEEPAEAADDDDLEYDPKKLH